MGTEMNREGDGLDGNEETQPDHADHSYLRDFNDCAFMDNLSHLLDDRIILTVNERNSMMVRDRHVTFKFNN